MCGTTNRPPFAIAAIARAIWSGVTTSVFWPIANDCVSPVFQFRPESSGRAESLWRAQAELAAGVTGALLRELCDRGDLAEQAPGRYSRGRRVGLGERLRLELYFRWSTVRSTARWAKHVLTFEGWLEYIVRKARRHSGQDIVLSARERRWPVIFLWPRLFRFLRNRNR